MSLINRVPCNLPCSMAGALVIKMIGIGYSSVGSVLSMAHAVYTHATPGLSRVIYVHIQAYSSDDNSDSPAVGSVKDEGEEGGQTKHYLCIDIFLGALHAAPLKDHLCVLAAFHIRLHIDLVLVFLGAGTG
jgi:hypothetical protein